MKNFYLIAAVLGGIVPYIFFAQFFQSEGLSLSTFIGGIFANGAAAGFTADLLISSAVFWGFLHQQQADKPWLYILINCTIGLSCALPLYLYMRERQLSSASPLTGTGTTG